MADITLTMDRDSSRAVPVVHKKKLAAHSKIKYTNRAQLAIAALLFLGGIAGVTGLALYFMVQEGVFLY
ncbi:hypothetical protein [Citrobacter youngae]|nr:hypothetical protein [Citrobacter youngae]